MLALPCPVRSQVPRLSRELSLDIAPPVDWEACVKDSDQTATSITPLNHQRVPLPIGRIRETCFDVFWCQFRKIIDQFTLGHSGCEITQNIRDSDSHSANAGLSASFSGLDRDDVSIIHSVANCIRLARLQQ